MNKKARKIVTIIAIIIVVGALTYIILHGRHYFSHRNIRSIQSLIKSYGYLSPLIVMFLIFLSTAIPPLPLPIPLIEITAGLMFGFLPGFMFVWISQIGSSLFAFGISRLIGKHFFKKIVNNHIFDPYTHYIREKGSMAVFVIRTTMAAPFNIISFLAGLTQMHVFDFTVATAFGTILESAFYVYIGTLLRSTRLRLWYVFILVVVLGAAPLLILLIANLFKRRFESKKK